MKNEIIISKINNRYHQIAFICDGIYDYVGPYEEKYHKQYLEQAKIIKL
jgi:hypothetical protein